MAKSGKKPSTVYTKAGVTKQHFSKIKNNADPNETFVVCKINDNKGNSLLYKSFRFSEMSSKSAGGYKFFKARTTFFLNGKNIVDLPMYMRLFSAEKLEIEYKDLKIKVEGLPNNTF